MDVTGWSPHRRGRAGIARTFQHSRSFRGLTVRENVEVAALGVGAPAARGAPARADELLEPARARATRGRDRRRRSRTATSGGSASPARSRPSRAFVLLDEPAAGLPEAEVPEFAAVVRSVRDDHDAGVLLIDHNMALVMEVCDRIHVLDQGRTLAAGTPAEIRGNLDVASAYLGESAVAEATSDRADARAGRARACATARCRRCAGSTSRSARASSSG